MPNPKAGQKRKSIAPKKHQKKPKHTSIPESSPSVSEDEPTESLVEEKQDNDDGLFDNLNEEMDTTGLDDIVRKLEGGSDSSDAEDVMSEDEASPSEEEEEEQEEQEQENEGARIEKPAAKPKFRDHYMGQMTRAFGSDLDKIRQEPTFNASQLPILIDSLEAGIDIFSNLEQEIILADAVQE